MGATPGMQWAQLLTQMGGQQNQAIASGAQAGTAAKNADIRQQMADQQEQQEYRQNQQNDLNFYQHINDEGGLWAAPGTKTVKETRTLPDQPVPGLPGLTMSQLGVPTTISIMRQMDPDRTHTYKDADGDTHYFEAPTTEQARALQLQTLYARNKAASEGMAAGTPQYPLTPQDASDLGLPSGATSISQPEAARLAVPRIRGNTQLAVTDKNVAGRQSVADTKAQTDADRLDATTAYNQQHEDDLNKWNAAKLANARYLAGLTTGRQKVTQDATDRRNFQDNFNRNVQLHTTLSKNILAENQKQLGANNILGSDANGQPNTPDGASFNDPFNGGKPTVMNKAQRLILGQRSAASAAASTDMLKTKGQLESQRDNILARVGGVAPGGAPSAAGAPGAAAPAGGGSPAATAAPQSAAPPTAGAPSARPGNWADKARAQYGSSAALPGRAAPTPTPAAAPAAQTPAPVQHKAGETRTYNGRPYKFNGRQWVGQ